MMLELLRNNESNSIQTVVAKTLFYCQKIITCESNTSSLSAYQEKTHIEYNTTIVNYLEYLSRADLNI